MPLLEPYKLKLLTQMHVLVCTGACCALKNFDEWRVIWPLAKRSCNTLQADADDEGWMWCRGMRAGSEDDGEEDQAGEATGGAEEEDETTNMTNKYGPFLRTLHLLSISVCLPGPSNAMLLIRQ